MSDSFFSSDSAFAISDLSRKIHASRLPSLNHDGDQTRTAAIKEAKAPIAHWHHDIETILILLEERHPDVRRAADLLREIQREMDQWE